MTEQQRVDKLKARMNRWQAYVDKPQTNAVQRSPEAEETHEILHQRRMPRTPNRPEPRLLLEPTRGTPSGREGSGTRTPAFDPLTDFQEARIADLQIAVAREREQADRMAEEVRREQNLHAATLYSHLMEEQARSAVVRTPQTPMPDPRPVDFEEMKRKNLVRLISVFFFLTTVLVAAFFVSR